MNLLIAAIAAALVIAFVLHEITRIVREDGYGRRSGQRTPPQSHFPDPFYPRSRMA